LCPEWRYDAGRTRYSKKNIGSVAWPVEGEKAEPNMRDTRLKFIYVIAVFLAGLLLTTSVVVTLALSERQQQQQIDELGASIDEAANPDAVISTAELQQRIDSLNRSHFGAEVLVIGIIGLLLSLVAAWITSLLIDRVDRGMMALIASADRIGSGRHSEPVLNSGVREVAALEDSMEKMRQALARTTISRDYLNTLLNSMSDAVLVAAPDGQLRNANAAALELLGRPREDVAGRKFESLIADKHRSSFEIEKVLGGRGETVVRNASGQTIPVQISASEITSEDPAFKGTIFVLRDITERKRAERRIRYLARFDALTKMPNRMQFQHLLQQALARGAKKSQGLVLLYVDVDNFKDINDTFGHNAGDRVLETMSERVTRILPSGAVVGRLAGDEFAIFAENEGDAESLHEQAARLARMILNEVSRPLHLGEHEVEITASIGIAACPKDADNVIDLIRDADAAMYHAKRAGRNCYVFYSAEMNAAAVERLLLKSKLRRAVERNEFVVRYQPKVDLGSDHVVGAEALLRWRLPGHGEIAPAQFIPLAEESRLILDIGAWVLNQVCSDYADWSKRVADPGRVAINLSLKELSQASFIPNCRSVFERHGVSPSCVELEITETTLMLDAEQTLPLLDELRSMGVHLSIDDFGTGYSSLSALQQFPIGTLKIDQSFVRNAAEDPEDATIVRTIIEMGRSLGLQVIAEGIETEEQRHFLLHSGCQYGQGRLFGDPIPADDFLDLLLRQATGEHPILLRPA
jgi:diguanylate cyclase (GGDEF)-like protein/PAS domain S-box-containing protein